MKNRTHVLHKAELSNNCPVCFAKGGLEFTFTQEEKETKFYTKAASIPNEVLRCHICNNRVYPVNWNNDIERVYEYNKKIAAPKASFVRIKPVVYILILIFIVIVASLIYLLIRY